MSQKNPEKLSHQDQQQMEAGLNEREEREDQELSIEELDAVAGGVGGRDQSGSAS